MKSYTRLIAIGLLSIFILLQGCSKDDDNSSGGSGGGGTPPVQKVSTYGAFSIAFSDENIKVIDYKLSIKRGNEDITDTLADYIAVKRQDDGSLVIALHQVEEGSSKKGLTSLNVGDVITLEAKGYTSQQFTVDEGMQKQASTTITLKAVESRQTFYLSDMTSGTDTVTPRSARGATTKVSGENIVFETLDKGTSLSIPKTTYSRLARSISRLPRSGADTEVSIDMTSVDPRTDHNATIGDFSYDPSGEPQSERATNANDDGETGLVSVVMADLKMTTDSGDEIHCFDGSAYDETTNSCAGSAKATLKMKIPQSQFAQYADKYNDGDRVVPLYSYNKAKATWVRQLDSDGKGLDAELVLTDNDNNQKANSGDELYLIGKVGHFSYWNGDYTLSRTCLNVPVDLSAANGGASYVRVKGVDYAGREFTSYFSNEETTLVKGISAKENAIVRIELIMSDGAVGDWFTYSTGARVSGVCEDVNETLVAPAMYKHTVSFIVKDTEGNLLKNAYISVKNRSAYTDENGAAEVILTTTNTDFNASASVSYSNDVFRATDTKEITEADSTVTFVLDMTITTIKGHVVEEINGQRKSASKVYVQVYNYGTYYYNQYVYTDENGDFEIKLPKSKVQADPEAHIYIYKYNYDYSFYQTYSKDITLDANSNPTYVLSFITHKVTGQVTDATSNPIPNATVYSGGAISRSTRCDEDGNYELILVGEADKDVSLRAYTYVDRYLYSDTVNFKTVVDGSTTQNLVIDLRKATIKGRILTSAGIALENMRVYWSQDYYAYTKTDANGYFSIESYTGGDGYIRVYNPSSYQYLDFDKNIDKRDIELNGVEVGKVYDLGNQQAVNPNYAPIISSVTIDPNTPLTAVDFLLNIDAYDPDGDTLTYDVKEYYNNSAVISNETTATPTVNAPTSGYYYFKVIVTDANGNSTSKTVSVYVKNHVRPVIDSITYSFPNNKSYFDKSKDLNITVVTHSSEGNALTYSYDLKSLTTGVADKKLDPTNTGTIIPADTTNGKYKLVVTVSDVYNATSSTRYITIDNSVAPEIASFTMNGVSQSRITIKENSSVTFNVTLSDPDNVTAPKWYWYVNGNSYTTQNIDPVTFTQNGYYYGYVTVRDALNRSDTQYFYVNVTENAKPVITSVKVTPKTITKLDGKYIDENNNEITDMTLLVNASDSDDKTLQYTFGDLAGTKAVQDGNSASYTLASDLKVGRHAIKVSVSDGTNTVDKFVNIEVLKNNPPIITEFIVPLNGKIGKSITMSANAYDPNGQSVTYRWSATAGTVGDATKKVTSLTLPTEVQDINVTLTVSDGVNTTERTRVINVLDNAAPVITLMNLRTTSITLSNQTIAVKSSYGDPDGYITKAIYKVKNSKGKVVALKNITQSDVVTTWELKLTEVGTYKLFLEITDDSNKIIRSKEATLSVEKENSAPVITSLTASSANILAGEVSTITVAATDADGDAVSFAWATTGGILTEDAQNQDKVTFSADETGTYTITVIASDTNNLKSIRTIDISVQKVTMTLSTDKTSYVLGEDVTITASMSSDHAVPTSTAWSIIDKPSDSNLTLNKTGVSVTLTPDAVGIYKVQATTTINGVDFTATQSFSVQEKSLADVEGVVTSDNGDILNGAKVRLYNKTDATLYDVTTTTDSSGYYSFSNVPSGTYYLVVYAGNGYVRETQTLVISK